MSAIAASPWLTGQKENRHAVPIAHVLTALRPKTNLGLNSRQVSVRKSTCGLRYLDLTVRDPGVDVSKVHEFANAISTWKMDEGDNVSGQSISVFTSPEVDKAHAAPFIEEVMRSVETLVANRERNLGTLMSNGKIIEPSSFGYRVLNKDTLMRSTDVYAYDVNARTDWAIEGLALALSRT